MSQTYKEIERSIENKTESGRYGFESDYKVEPKGTTRYLDIEPISITPHGVEYGQKQHDEAYNKVIDSIKPLNKYQRHVNSTTIDVYDVLVAFEVNNPATAHAVKKLLASGKRGYKDIIQDLEEAMQSIKRAIEIEKGE